MAYRIHPATDETLQDIARSLRTMAGNAVLEWDQESGCYTNESVKAWLDTMNDSNAYGVSIPIGSATACTKTGANAGIAAPTPGIIGRPAVDPYVSIPAFMHWDVNARIDADGTSHLTGIDGDGRFRRDGTNGNVWVMTPVLYTAYSETQTAVSFSVSKSRLQGMSLQPGGALVGNVRRPYMLYAKYPLGTYDGSPSSVSGMQPRIRDVSHNAGITICGNATTGYSLKSYVDDWYLQVMFWLKYATKNSQSVFGGCSSYNYTYPVTVAESDTTRVIIASSQAANLVVGSSACVGTSDRGQQVCADSRIVKVEAYDSSNSAVYLDAPAPFTTTTSANLYTVPWACGSCDAVEGDGSPFSNTSRKEPFTLQGIEVMHGMTEVLGDVILSNTGSGWEACTLLDSRKAATSVTSDYTHTGVYLPTDNADSWKYPLYAVSAGGLLVGQGTGGSETTGMCDGHYTNKLATTGTREWLGLGILGSGGTAGLRCVGGYGGLDVAGWNIGSRLSANGRKGVNAA